jgi:putative acetyltransferase
MELKIRSGVLSELPEIQNLFFQTITFVCQNDYDQQQIEAWRSSVENVERWHNLIKNQYFIVAELNQQIVGFASLDNGNYIDVLFVHKDFQRMRIAQKLFAELESKAKESSNFILTSDVSKTAKAFFESNGFKVIAEQIQVRENIEIVNFKMQKQLSNSNG